MDFLKLSLQSASESLAMFSWGKYPAFKINDAEMHFIWAREHRDKIKLYQIVKRANGSIAEVEIEEKDSILDAPIIPIRFAHCDERSFKFILNEILENNAFEQLINCFEQLLIKLDPSIGIDPNVEKECDIQGPNEENESASQVAKEEEEKCHCEIV